MTKTDNFFECIPVSSKSLARYNLDSLANSQVRPCPDLLKPQPYGICIGICIRICPIIMCYAILVKMGPKWSLIGWGWYGPKDLLDTAGPLLKQMLAITSNNHEMPTGLKTIFGRDKIKMKKMRIGIPGIVTCLPAPHLLC